MPGDIKMAEDAGIFEYIFKGGVTLLFAAGAYVWRNLVADVKDNAKALSAHELKVAENYATKSTVISLFQEATTQTKDAVARVEKSVDSTNSSVKDVNLKIDKVVESIGIMQQNVLHELSKKT